VGTEERAEEVEETEGVEETEEREEETETEEREEMTEEREEADTPEEKEVIGEDSEEEKEDDHLRMNLPWLPLTTTDPKWSVTTITQFSLETSHLRRLPRI